MKSTVVLCSGLLLLTVNFNDTGKESSSFELVRAEGNISIYSRWLNADESCKTRQLKAVFIVNAPSQKVIDMLTNERACIGWMRSTKDYYRLKTEKEMIWYSYIQFSVPWPLNNQDCILKYNLIQDTVKSQVLIHFVNDNELIGPVEGVNRITHLEGSWILSETNDSSTLIEYYVYSKQPPKFPSWITDPIIQKNLLKTMQGLNNALKNTTSTDKG
jgi:hypothetical protein